MGKINIGLVTDDICTLPQEIIEKHQIEVVRTKLIFPELSKFPGENMYKVMDRTKIHPKTSAPSPGDYLKAYRKQFQRFKKILVVTLSKLLSATFNSARDARLLTSSPEDIVIVDSKQVVAAEGLVVLRAKQLIDKGLEVHQIKSQLTSEEKEFRMLGFLKTTYWVEKIGRMSSWQGRVFELLKRIGIQPVIGTKKGKVSLVGFNFWDKETVSALLSQLKRESKHREIVVGINYTDNKEIAFQLKQRVEEELAANIIFVSEAAPIIGANSGPGTLLVGCGPKYD